MPVTGFREAKRRVREALAEGAYQHEARNAIDVKNELSTGAISAAEVRAIVARCNGTHHTASPHRADASVRVHVLRRDGWYIKFYFLDEDAVFISVLPGQGLYLVQDLLLFVFDLPAQAEVGLGHGFIIFGLDGTRQGLIFLAGG